MLNLIFAPNAELLVPLASKLVREIWTDPFQSPTVIVPNPAIGKWLSMRLAQGQPQCLSDDNNIVDDGLGCVANARIVTLEPFLWNALQPSENISLLDANQLAQIIEALLDENLLKTNIYKPLRNYLCHSDNNNKIDPLKRVQLSARIASLFLEYEYNRPSVWNESAMQWRRHGIDASWLLGKNYFNNPEHEPWQKNLYEKVFNCLHKNNNEKTWTTLPHLYRKKREISVKEKRAWCNIDSQIILFNVSKISHFHRNTLVEISQIDGAEMHLFLTNPCAEFWEDVDTSRKRTSRVRWSHNSSDKIAAIKPMRSEDYDKSELNLFDDTEDHALLKLWGGAGKENIYLWCPQAQWNFHYYCPALDENKLPQTLLHSLQKSLLTRQNDLYIKDDAMMNDGSLQLLASPDASREIEELRELILDMVHTEKINKFDEIAVYIPDMSAYQPHILRVFGAYSQSDPQYIPFTILGESGASSLVNQGMCNLLNIISGKFNRTQIFALFRNPIVQTSRNFPQYMVTTWEQWAQDLGMYRGFNALGRKRMGDKGEAVTDIHTFKYGLDQLRQNVIDCALKSVDSVNGNDDDDNAETSGKFNNLEFSEYKIQAFEIFSVLLEELDKLSDEFYNNGSPLNISEAVELTKKAVWHWFGTIPHNNERIKEAGAEEKIRQKIVEGIEQIAFQESIAKRKNMTIEEFTALVQTCLPQELPSSSSNWNSVTFAPLKQSLITPHKAIFVLGLNASSFPGTNDKGKWDLLSEKRIIGDSDAVKENRFAFLELIHAAKESLILSYKARDMQKDEILQPSSVVLELEDYLINQGVSEVKDGQTRCSVRREIPWVVHESLDTPILAGRIHGTWDKTQRELAKLNANTRVGHRHEIASPPYGHTIHAPDANAPKNQNEYAADINDIKRFFSNPLEYHLYRTLGIGPDDNREDMAQSDEPLVSGYYLSRLRKNLWSAVLELLFPDSDNNNIIDEKNLERKAASIAENIYENHIVSGRAPEGYLCRMERDELVKWSQLCVSEAVKLLSVFTDHKLVKECDFSLCGENRPCFMTITNEKGHSFSINGVHPLALIPKDWNNTKSGAAIIAFNKDEKLNPADNNDLWLEGILQWIYEQESTGRLPLSLIQLNYGKPDIQISQMKISTDKSNEIKKWLTTILEQMLIENRSEYLPFKVIQKIGLQELDYHTFKDKLSDGKTYKCYMDAFNLTDAQAPQFTNDELRELAGLRFTPILDRWMDI